VILGIATAAKSRSVIVRRATDQPPAPRPCDVDQQVHMRRQGRKRAVAGELAQRAREPFGVARGEHLFPAYWSLSQTPGRTIRPAERAIIDVESRRGGALLSLYRLSISCSAAAIVDFQKRRVDRHPGVQGSR
jgi:hypothetical protein